MSSVLGPRDRPNVIPEFLAPIRREVAEVHAEMMSVLCALGLMFDRAMGEEGAFVEQRDDELDCCFEIATGELPVSDPRPMTHNP